MDLYFAPLACSMATKIALREAGAEARLIQVDTRAKTTVADGGDFRAVNSLGQVPVLRTDDGELLTENTAILQYVARLHPEANLLGAERELPWVQQWLSFVSTELHQAVFMPLLNPASPEATKAAAHAYAVPRFERLERHLAGRSFLTEGFTVADAYLATVLTWCPFVGIDVARWPAVMTYLDGILARPSAARTLEADRALYAVEKAKLAA